MCSSVVKRSIFSVLEMTNTSEIDTQKGSEYIFGNDSSNLHLHKLKTRIISCFKNSRRHFVRFEKGKTRQLKCNGDVWKTRCKKAEINSCSKGVSGEFKHHWLWLRFSVEDRGFHSISTRRKLKKCWTMMFHFYPEHLLTSLFGVLAASVLVYTTSGICIHVFHRSALALTQY